MSMLLLGAGTPGGASFTPLSLSPALWLKADAGLVTDGAAQFTAANSEYLSKSSTSSLQTGDIDYWGACWIYKDSNVTAWLMQKGADVGGWEYTLETQPTGIVRFLPMNSGGGGIGGGSTGVLSTGAWHFIFFCYDSVNNLNSISADGGAFTDYAVTGVCTAGTGPFILSGYGNIGTPGYYHNGRMDAVCFGKNPTGGIAGIRTAIRDALYNSGSGVRYSSLTTQQKSDWGLQSFWNLDEVSGTRLDSHGSNDLTDNNTVTYAAGIVSGTASADGDPVTTWQDQSGNGRHAVASTSAKRPTLKLAIQNGMPALLYDGVDDYLSSTVTTIAQPLTVVAVGKATGAGNQYYFDGTGNTAAVGNDSATTKAMMYAGGTSVGKTGLTADAWRILLAEFNGASSALYVNNLAAATGNAGSSATGTTLNLGRYGGDGLYLNGYLGEVLVVPSIMSTQQRSDLQAYLNARWGVY